MVHVPKKGREVMIVLKFILICVGLIILAALSAGVLLISELVSRDKYNRDCVDLSVDEAVEQFEKEKGTSV